MGLFFMLYAGNIRFYHFTIPETYAMISPQYVASILAAPELGYERWLRFDIHGLALVSGRYTRG